MKTNILGEKIMPYFECPICHFALNQKSLLFQSFLSGSIEYYQCINPECANFKKVYIEDTQQQKPNGKFKIEVLMKGLQPLENPIITETMPKSCDQFDIKPKKPRKKKERVAYDYCGGSRRRHSYNKKNY